MKESAHFVYQNNLLPNSNSISHKNHISNSLSSHDSNSNNHKNSHPSSNNSSTPHSSSSSSNQHQFNMSSSGTIQNNSSTNATGAGVQQKLNITKSLENQQLQHQQQQQQLLMGVQLQNQQQIAGHSQKATPNIYNYQQHSKSSKTQRLDYQQESDENKQREDQRDNVSVIMQFRDANINNNHSRKKSLSQFKKSANPLSVDLKASQTQQPQDDQILSVRQFLPLHQTNASRSNISKNKFNSKQNGPSAQILPDEEETIQISSLLLQVSENGELNLKNQKICEIPRAIYSSKLDHILILNIRGNQLTRIEEDLCKNLIQMRKFDARNNKIKEISPHIKAMMQLKTLRLDHNELSMLPNEIGELQLLQELSFSNNKIIQIPTSIQKLRQLKLLNLAENNIKHIPQELGELRELSKLYLHGNKFASFPCSFVNFVHTLEELSLEWFMYARPPKPTLVKRSSPDGSEIFQQLEVLCQLLQKYKMNECAFITFLENYSINALDINSKDNRQRTPLHNAAVKGDNGVLEGLLLGKANPNLLDKDNCTPLCLAIREDNFEAAVILINERVDVNLGGGIFGSPLHLAVVKVEVWIVKKLIQTSADVNKTDNEGNTPLHLVMTVFSKNPQKCASIAELLIMNGAKVNIKNNDNWAPLHSAVRKGQEKGVQTAIRLNQMLREKNMELFDLNITGGAQQFTALQLAAHGAYVQIVKDLIHAGGDIFQRNLHYQLPRHCAKGNYILTKFIKLAEQAQSRKQYQSYQVHNQYELLQNVTQKKQNKNADESQDLQKQQKSKKSNIEVVADEYAQNYDTFMNNIAQLKVIKAFTQLEVIKKSRQISDISGFKKQMQINHQNFTAQQAANQSITPMSVKSSQVQVTFSKQLLTNDKQTSHHQHLAKSQTINPQDLKQSNGSSQESIFTYLNLKAEEKKINIFYLQDILIKDSSTYPEKLDALQKIKKNQFKQVFAAAMRGLLPDFDKIGDQFIQKEILFCVANSCQFTLLHQLKDLRQKIEDSSEIKEDLEDTIQALEVCAKRPISYSFKQHGKGTSSSGSFGGIKGGVNSFSSLMKSSIVNYQQLKVAAAEANPLKASVAIENNTSKSSVVDRNVDSGEKSRNINSFKMKGMSSLVGSGVGGGNSANKNPNSNLKQTVHQNGVRSAAGTPAAQNQAFKRPNFLEGIDDTKIVTSLQFNNQINQHGHSYKHSLGQTQPLNQSYNLSKQALSNQQTKKDKIQAIFNGTDDFQNIKDKQRLNMMLKSEYSITSQQPNNQNLNPSLSQNQQSLPISQYSSTSQNQNYLRNQNDSKVNSDENTVRVQNQSFKQQIQGAKKKTLSNKISAHGNHSSSLSKSGGTITYGKPLVYQPYQNQELNTRKNYTNHMIIRLASDGDCQNEDSDDNNSDYINKQHQSQSAHNSKHSQNDQAKIRQDSLQNNFQKDFQNKIEDEGLGSEEEEEAEESPSVEYDARGINHRLGGIMSKTVGGNGTVIVSNQTISQQQKQNSQRHSVSIPAKK